MLQSSSTIGSAMASQGVANGLKKMGVMFDFFKNLGKLHFTVIDYGQGVVKFRCSKNLPLGEKVEGIADLPDGQKMELQIQLVQRTGGAYSGRVLGPKPGVAILEKLFLADISKGKEQMFYKLDSDDPTHHMRTYAVRSRHLPNFRALTSEVSMSEATLVLHGQVQEGLQLTLHLDLDDPQAPPIDIEAKVDWCKQRDDKFWVARLSVISISDEQKPILKQFLADLKGRRPGSASTLDHG
jgi:hypothetical protein